MLKVLAEQFNQSVLAMVRKAAERVSPAETLGNRRRRRDARRRLAQRYQEAPAVDQAQQR
jgi:type IV secretory pathway VirB6-like protein